VVLPKDRVLLMGLLVLLESCDTILLLLLGLEGILLLLHQALLLLLKRAISSWLPKVA
jgi:hypothetical protein